MTTGEDTSGRKYATVDDLWSEVGTPAGREAWFAKGTSYWNNQEANLDGILGGFPEIHKPDIQESKRFLKLLFRQPSPPGCRTVLDAGAGIGRVTVGLLQHVFEQVDLVEPNERLLEAAQQAMDQSKAGRCFTVNLQDLVPEQGYYDVIWIQWVVMYLPEDDLVAFLQRCAAGLRIGGAIIMKENVVLQGHWIVDRDDNSIARTDDLFKDIFRKAGLTVTAELKQTCWPKDLIPVKMYALKPHVSVRKRPAMAS